MNPLLLDSPATIETDRLTLRIPQVGQGAIVAEAVVESLPQLQDARLVWATETYNADTGEEWCRKSAAAFLLGKEFPYCLFTKSGDLAGTINAFAFDWAIPACEIGYWMRSRHVGHGLMTEAVHALTAMLTTRFAVRRIQIRCDARNLRSAAVALRCGFQLDGTLRHANRAADGTVRDMRVYSKLFDQESSR